MASGTINLPFLLEMLSEDVLSRAGLALGFAAQEWLKISLPTE